MKKNIIMLLTLFAFMVSVVSVHAAPRTISIKPSISFDGTTAKCSVSVVADKMSDSVSATLVLWDGSKVIDSWTPLEPDICCSVIQHRWWKEDAIH